MKIDVAELEGFRTPRLAGSGPPVGAVVHACHNATIDQGLAQLAVAGLGRETLEPVLTYCAELRCEADGATCPGCKRRTEVQGIGSARRLHRAPRRDRGRATAACA